MTILEIALPTGLPLAIALAALYFGRNIIEKRVKNSIDHTFNEKIEQLRSDLKKQEREHEKHIQEQTDELKILRDKALGRYTVRQKIIETRKMDALDAFWSETIRLSQFKHIAQTMMMIKFDNASQRTPKEEKLIEFFGTLGKDADPQTINVQDVKKWRPYVSPLLWALFSAYHSIIAYSVIKIKTLELGIEEPAKLLKDDHTRNLLSTVYPHNAESIQEMDSAIFYNFLDDIEEKILREIRELMAGKSVETEDLKYVKDILQAVKRVNNNADPGNAANS